MVLRADGYQVIAETDLYALDPSLSAICLDLLILCHTIRADDAIRIAALARSRWPSISTLVLTRGWSSQPVQLLRAVLDATAEPDTPAYLQARTMIEVLSQRSGDNRKKEQLRRTRCHSTKER